MQVNTPAITETNAPNVLIVASISGRIETKNPLLDITVPIIPFKVVLSFINYTVGLDVLYGCPDGSKETKFHFHAKYPSIFCLSVVVKVDP